MVKSISHKYSKQIAVLRFVIITCISTNTQPPQHSIRDVLLIELTSEQS